ncbi:MAG TPA: FUSC family protein [Pelagibacterium sp.]|uniref:FUSC family protein n=1 Tax=Pelagibacterium sp. TaxID=1967288 RepID=UPI002CBEFD78|nr:FUSC family protein [Pelagibacterium sp.]HWJ87691.1 FUSC family protein [Pelagibacterium sp.]
MIIGSSYGLGQILVAPMALLMTYLASPGADTAMVPERVIHTMLGAAIGISAAVLFSTVHHRQELARRHASRSRE